MSSLSLQQADVRVEVTWPDGPLSLDAFARALEHAVQLWAAASGLHRNRLIANSLLYEVSRE